MSGLPPKADITECACDVRFVPTWAGKHNPVVWSSCRHPRRVAMPTRRQSIVLGAASVFAPNLVRTASINAWPDRTVHMVVPNAAGGPTDVNVRTVAEQLSLTSAMPLWPTPILMVIHCYSVPHPLRRMALYLARSI